MSAVNKRLGWQESATMPDRKPTTLRCAVDAEDWSALARWLERRAIDSPAESDFASLLQAAATYRLVAMQQETADLHQIVRQLNERLAKLERG
jgi:hypothetical protein